MSHQLYDATGQPIGPAGSGGGGQTAVTTFDGRVFDRVPSAPGPHWPASSLIYRSREDIVLQGEIDALTARVAALEGGQPAPTPPPEPTPTPTPTPTPPPPAHTVGLILDQGNEGECVGHGWTAWCEWMGLAVPQEVLENPWAEDIYAEAGVIEGQWSEGHPDEQAGTSVVGGAKAAKKLHVTGLEYRLCASVDEARKMVAAGFGVVIGTDWYSAMMNADGKNLIHPSGSVVGGHCLFWPENTNSGNAVWQNSWGNGWAQDGLCEITDADLRKLWAGGNLELWVPTIAPVAA